MALETNCWELGAGIPLDNHRGREIVLGWVQVEG